MINQNIKLHFGYYINSVRIFFSDNINPNVKVKCLEILKIHVDTLPRVGKQVFIEKVVLENLDRARDFENNIPFEVQVKCFELIITYIKDISEAAEGVLLNSTLLEYIKTTTDERIMIIILNVTKFNFYLLIIYLFLNIFYLHFLF